MVILFGNFDILKFQFEKKKRMSIKSAIKELHRAIKEGKGDAIASIENLILESIEDAVKEPTPFHSQKFQIF